MRNRKGSELEDEEPLDEAEQDEILKNLGEQNEKMNKFWRMCMLGTIAFLTLVKLFSGLFPLKIGPHWVFIGVVEPTTIGVMELISTVCFILTGFYTYATEENKQKQVWCIYASTGISAICFFVWALKWSDYILHIVWLFGINILVSGMAYYSDSLIAGNNEELRKLYGLKYHFKRV